jgi:hypothetical protein
MRPGDLRTIRDSAVIGILGVLLLKRSGRLGRRKAGPSRINHRTRHRGPLETATCGGSHMFFRIVRLWEEPHKAQTARLGSGLARIQIRSMRQTSP